MPQTTPRTNQNPPAVPLAPVPDDHVAAAVDRHGADQPGYEWVALSVTSVGALLASLQGSSLVIALPDVLTGLNARFLTIMWVLLGYLLITTALVPVVGRLADIVGRKRLYVAGFAVFTLASLLSGLAQPQFHGWDLVAYRVLQGVGGALLITNSTAIVADAFRHGRVGLGLGVNQVAGAAGFLLVLGLGGLLLGLSLVAFPMLPMPVVYALFVVAVLGLAGFVVAEVRVRQPML